MNEWCRLHRAAITICLSNCMTGLLAVIEIPITLRRFLALHNLETKTYALYVRSGKKENAVTRDSETTERLRWLIDQISSLTEKQELHWERQSGSAHRYARLNGNLLILGPATLESN